MKNAQLKKSRRHLIWLAGMLVILLMDRWIPDMWWDRYYYRGFFQVIRVLYDYILGWIPVPMVYLVLVCILYRIFRLIRHPQDSWVIKCLRVCSGIAILVIAFYVLWGYNYHQPKLAARMGMDLKKVTAAEVAEEFSIATEELRLTIDALPSGMTSADAIKKRLISEKLIRDEVEKSLILLALPHRGKVRIRQLWPKGFLLRWSTAGIYIPHTGEGHIDMGLLSVQKPFTMAHEMSHGYGVADERDCNFIAWLACHQASDPWIRFSGALMYWRYVAAEMKREEVRTALDALPAVVEQSLQWMYENGEKYPDLMPQLRDLVYGSYLKHHGVEGGLRSYNEVVLMVQQYRALQK